jgi:uncharacterized protein (DUF2237 family)
LDEPSLDDVESDPIPPGHPEIRPGEHWCVIQRSAAIREAEEALKFSVVALIADSTRELGASYVARAVG